MKAVKDGTIIQLLRHYDNDYRMAKISGLPAPTPAKKFGRGQFSSANNSERFLILIPDLASYQSKKQVLFDCFDKAAEMAGAGWTKRLKISFGNRDKREASVKSIHDNIEESFDAENNFPRVYELCEKYLSSDYTYDL